MGPRWQLENCVSLTIRRVVLVRFPIENGTYPCMHDTTTRKNEVRKIRTRRSRRSVDRFSRFSPKFLVKFPRWPWHHFCYTVLCMCASHPKMFFPQRKDLDLNLFPCQNSISAKLKVKKRSTLFDFSKNAFDAKVMQVMHVIDGVDSISAQTLARESFVFEQGGKNTDLLIFLINYSLSVLRLLWVVFQIEKYVY